MYIYFHLTSPEFVGPVSMETIQRDGGVHHPHVHTPPYLCWRGALAPSHSDSLSENREEQYLKCTQKPGLKSKEHCLPLTLLAASKGNEDISTQPGSNMVNICMATESEGHWPVFKWLECCCLLVYFCSFFCDGEERQAICF